MSIITRLMAATTEPQFQLARDLMAMAIADGQITDEEKEAIRTLCHLECIDENELMTHLQSEHNAIKEEIPLTRQSKEQYLIELIKLIGADGHAAPQEIYLFQIIASKMGLNQMDVTSLFLTTATHRYFKGAAGSKILASFLQNYIAPKGKSDASNRANLRTIYETIAASTEENPDRETYKQSVRQNLAHATATFLENKILIKEFADVGVDFATMVKQEELRLLHTLELQ